MNKIIIELSAEDRARLDKLTEAIEKSIAVPHVENTVNITPAEPQNDAQEAPKAEPQESAQPTPENGAGAEPEPVEQPEPVKDEPTVTLEQIQQKVVQLAAGNGGAKKAQVREIISTYGAKVSDLKDKPDKWMEVWYRLIALEVEG